MTDPQRRQKPDGIAGGDLLPERWQKKKAPLTNSQDRWWDAGAPVSSPGVAGAGVPL